MLPRENRLKRDQDFKALFSKGKSVFDVVCGLKFRPNKLPVSRFAVVVGVKVSKSAVKRNRLRRQIREVLRLRLSELAPGFDVVLMVRPEAKNLSQKDLEKHTLAVLTRAKLFRV